MRVVPTPVSQLVDILDLERLDLDLYRGAQPPHSTLQRVFGGQVAAQALIAAIRSVDGPDGLGETHQPHSLHSYFLRGGDTAVPIIYDVERIRDGRSFSTRRVSARQHGRAIFYLTASFQRPERGLEHQDAMPEVSAAADCPDLAEVLGTVSARAAEDWRREWSTLDVHYAGDTRDGGGMEPHGRPARARMWFRASDELPDDDALHTAVLTYASDLTLLGSSLVPHGVLIGQPGLQAASLDHAIWFHRPVRADRWLLYDQVSPSASGGRGFAHARIFAADGTLVASVAQEGLIRVRG
ncbi:MAG: acyl-CoA thioesterase II [Nocardioidaceae bacterium]|nr:acyl-CoA thioesterase II [Nocardioidaceae bacterium]